MAIIRTASNGIRRGRVGDTTYYYRNGEQVARQARNNSNYGAAATRAPMQQYRRVKWANLVNFFRLSSSWMKGAFESKLTNQTDYNAFMSRNVGSSDVSLTKDMARNNACVICPYIVSRGTLYSISYSYTPSGPPAIHLGIYFNLTIGASTTIKQLSEAIIAAGFDWQNGDNLAYVFYGNTLDNRGYPIATCVYYEFTLDTSNTALVSTLPIYEVLNVGENGLWAAHGEVPGIAVNGFAAIHTRRADRLQVSSQEVLLISDALVQQFSTDEWEQECIDSYGVDVDVVLAPN